MEHAPEWVPIAIAIGSVVVVPAAVWFGRKLAKAWHDHRVKVLGEIFCTRKEVEVQFDTLNETQARQHRENKALLESLQQDGYAREVKVTTMLDGARRDTRDDTKELRDSVAEVHKRVDSVLSMLGNRRRQ